MTSPAQSLRSAIERIPVLDADDRSRLMAACAEVEALEEDVRLLSMVRPGTGRFTAVSTEVLVRTAKRVDARAPATKPAPEEAA